MGDITNYAIPFFILTLIIEISISIYGNKKYYTSKDAIASISMGLGSIATSLLTKGAKFGIFSFIYAYRITEIPMVFWGIVLLILADDFSYYWFHRLSHRVRYFWASHVVHHSSTHYNLSTALRQTWTGELSGSFLFYAWMPLVGFDPLWILTAQSISLIYQYWIHTEVIKVLPAPIEYIFNTPSHHRVHHASDLKYLDMNYAGILIIWDRLFGTFIKESETPKYGLVTNIKTYNIIRIALSEWRSVFIDVWNAPGILNKLKYIWGPPGWSHDGSRLTTDQMRNKVRK
ncbi:MAG: C-5 sterol desaturase [Bacteroidetes bacterium]|nr:MAG: C-5 sterol desaturase [Bacteroidota bacterium]